MPKIGFLLFGPREFPVYTIKWGKSGSLDELGYLGPGDAMIVLARDYGAEELQVLCHLGVGWVEVMQLGLDLKS